MEQSRQEATKHYLTIVPAVSSTLDDPAYAGDNAENTRDPVAAVKDPDRLNYARGPSTAMYIVGCLIRVWATSKAYLGIPRILKKDNQDVDRRG